MISIDGLDKALVLAALYNASRPLGMGFVHYDPTPMSRDEAAAILEQSQSFDYLKGRVMKVNLRGDEFDPWGYDRDNGDGAAAAAIDALRREGPDGSDIRSAHAEGTAASLAQAKEMVEAGESHTVSGGVIAMSGLPKGLSSYLNNAEKGDA